MQDAEEGRTPETRQLQTMALVCLLAWWACALRFALMGIWSTAIADVVAGTAQLLILVLAFRRPTPGLIRWMIGANALGLAAVVPLTGGVHSITFLYLPCIALIAFQQLARNEAIAWCAASLLLAMGTLLVPLPELVTYQPDAANYLFDALGAVFVTGVLAFVARRAHDQQALQLERAREEADEALQAKRRLLATVGHELRTPLVGTLGSAELLKQELNNPDHLRRVGTIIQCCEDLQGLLDDLLDQASLQEGGTSLVAQACDPVQLGLQVLELFGDQARSKGLELGLEGGAPRVVLDARRLRQVLINLVGNAVKFTPSGSVTLLLAHSERQLVIEVIDTGIGIADTERVLQPFEQGAPGIAERFGGTGLGLSISKGLLVLMGGGLELQSQLGEGTRARAWLRAPRVEQESVSVLIVEDNPVAARLTQEMLRRLGHSSQVATSLREARRVLKGGAFDVALLDLRLPDGSGLELLPELSRVGRVVAVTANAEERGATLQAGVQGFLAKPFRLEELEAILSS